MWPWNRGGENKHLGRIEALEKAVEAHNSGVKAIRLEWEDVYDRVNRTMGRLNARIRKSEAVQPGETDPEASGQPQMPFGTPTGTHAMLDAMRSRRR
jgi:hypothetical protein